MPIQILTLLRKGHDRTHVEDIYLVMTMYERICCV